jgi:hypothetical protein
MTKTVFHQNFLLSAITFSALALSSFSYAQEEPDIKNNGIFDDAPSVEISATKNPDAKAYRALLKGLDVFEKYRSAAPQAEPKFILKPRKEGLEVNHLSLRITYDEISVPLQIADDATFTLPRNAEAKEKSAEVLLNQKKDLFRWWPYIRSPQLEANQRRLGDLRLECHMLWAVYYDDIPFIPRNFIRALGGPCTSSKITIGFPGEFKGLQSATLKQGEQKMALEVNKKQSSFSAPLADKTWTDDAIIELQYEETDQQKRATNYAGLAVSMAF